MSKTKILGRLGVWLCNRYYPRPSTFCEGAQSIQYAQLMVDILRGNVPYYGRDRDENHIPIVAERVDYAAIYGRVAGGSETQK